MTNCLESLMGWDYSELNTGTSLKAFCSMCCLFHTIISKL